MFSWARHVAQNQAEIDALNKDYWQQDQNERIRRDVAKQGAIAGRSFAAGALSVLIDLHIERSEDRGFISDDDRLVESDVIAALSDPGYREYIEQGGPLSHAAWQRAESDRATLYAKPDDDLTDADWKAMHKLDLVLGY